MKLFELIECVAGTGLEIRLVSGDPKKFSLARPGSSGVLVTGTLEQLRYFVLGFRASMGVQAPAGS